MNVWEISNLKDTWQQNVHEYLYKKLIALKLYYRWKVFSKNCKAYNF